jgi:hypothetical protein
MTFASPASISVDFASLPLPDITSRPIATGTGLSWMQSGTGNPDIRLAIWIASWTDTNNVQRGVRYEIIEPPDAATSTTLPSLPDAYIEDDPTKVTTGIQIREPFVMYADYDNLNGYDEARPHGMELQEHETMFLDLEHQAHLSYPP